MTSACVWSGKFQLETRTKNSLDYVYVLFLLLSPSKQFKRLACSHEPTIQHHLARGVARMTIAKILGLPSHFARIRKAMYACWSLDPLWRNCRQTQRFRTAAADNVVSVEPLRVDTGKESTSTSTCSCTRQLSPCPAEQHVSCYF